MTSSIKAAKHFFEEGLYFFEEAAFSKAEEQFKKALELAPDRPSILVNLSATLIQLRKWGDCEKLCHKILSIDPVNYDAFLNLGVCLSHHDKPAEALECLDKAIELNPHSAQAWINKGNILQEIEEFEQAADCFDKALELNPQSQEAFIGRANLWNELKSYDSALKDLNAALKLNPSNSQAKWNKALSLLRLGEYKEGWRLYESRWEVPGMREHARHFEAPLWLGNEPLKNKTILIHAEQGYGDTIQFSRYIPMLESLGAIVILEVPKPLIEIMHTLGATTKVVESNSIDTQEIDRLIDFHCPIMSMPLAFNTTLSNIPNHAPYLFAEARKKDFWRKKLADISNQKSSNATPFRIGITWAGSGHYAGKKNNKRDLNAGDLTILLDNFQGKDIEFHSLQIKHEKNQEIDRLSMGRLHIHNLLLRDFSDTAALMTQMDVIVSIDTATAHLAGALNLPTLLLIPDPPDFMALTATSLSPWYRSVKLIRQVRRNVWPIEKISNSIKEFIN